jgi:3-isopropylmalate/(R)-2-methylmalate dehydratase small subunit
MRKLPTVSSGSGPRFVRHTGVVATVEVRDDQGELVPGDTLFASVRGASIVLAPEPFETAAPETAVARLTAAGVRAILSPGFEPRVYQRCISSGVLALPLEESKVEVLAEYVASRSGTELTIDLDKQVIERPDAEAIAFEVEPRIRQKLLSGFTDMEEMLRHVGSTAALRQDDRKRRPWLYGDR